MTNADYVRALIALERARRRREHLRAAVTIAAVIGALLAVLMLVSSCAPKTLSPRGQALYTSISFVDALHALQSSAIDANKLGGLSDADSIAIVKFTRASALTIQNVPDGWRPTVIAGWEELSRLIPPDRLTGTVRILWIGIASTINELKKGA